VIDLHTHLLPAIDDGPRTLEQSLDILRSMTDDGVRVVAATPHVRDDYPTTPQQMEDGVARLRAAAADGGLDVDIRTGGEIALERLATLDADARARFGLGGNPQLLLVEFPYIGWPPDLASACARLLETGVVPVLAHPERNATVQARPGDLHGLVRMGVVVQLTAASLDGRLGRAAASCSKRLLQLGLAHLLSSDAHAAGVREAGMSAAVKVLGDRTLAEWLTSSVPSALLAGDRIPARPPSAARPKLLGALRRDRRV
jgi:protein-tyrosine phosphatase